MALTTVPGMPGFAYALMSSMDNRAIGKFTDSNHLDSLRSDEPAMYDKRLIQIYTQSSLYSNDFLQMMEGSDPYYIDNNSDAWQWDVEIPYQWPKVLEIPTDTANTTKVGIDKQEFTLIFDTSEWAQNSIITSHKMFGPQFTVIKDPVPWNSGFLYTLTLNAENPKIEFVDKKYIQPGVDYQLISGTIGEFDQDLLGLPRAAKKMKMFESLGSAVGYEHTITGWADDRILKDSKGRPLDIMVYINMRRNEQAVTKNDIKWEPVVESMMRKSMLDIKVSKMIWQKPGTAKSGGTRQEIKKISAGVYHRMRNNGNYVSFNKGEFTPNIFRTVFGDLFYRRVDVANRRVIIYTNEAGFDTFEQSMKQDAFDSGLTFVVDSGNRFVEGTGRNLVMNYAFSGMVTRETGRIELKHLKELDLPQSNLEFGQNRKSAPVYMVFDVSPTGNGTLKGNVREVRMKGRPSMTWGYIDGRRHHLGAMASQGHSAGMKLDGYTLFMEDRYDVFIEDLSRTVLIEQIPQF